MTKCVFSFDLKIAKDDAFLISNAKGNLFHSLGLHKQMFDPALVVSVLVRFEFYNSTIIISRGLTN